MGKDPVTDAIHHELCAAISDLAKSVDIAVKRMAIRAKFTAAMADAQKTERAAAALRAAALENSGIVLGAAPAPQKPDSCKGTDIVEELNSACRWLMDAADPEPARKKKPENPTESAFARSLMELHDRTGGFLKSDSAA